MRKRTKRLLGNLNNMRTLQTEKIKFNCSTLACMAAWGAFLSVLTILVTGCGNKFWDPTQVGRFRPVPAVNVILDSLGVAEETPSAWEGAEEPRPIDTMVFDTDYRFGSGDVVRVSIFELQQEGVASINDYVVTETGKISIPEVGIVEAAGLTESQLEDEIKEILSPSILKDPSVTVTLLTSQKRMFSIWGNGVPAPGRYPIPRYNFRLTDALALAQVTTQFNVSYIYVTRYVTGEEPLTEGAKSERAVPGKNEKPIVPEDDTLEIIAPRAQGRPVSGLVITSAEMVTDTELTKLAMPAKLKGELNSAIPTGHSAKAISEKTSGTSDWEFKNNKWVLVEDKQPEQAAPRGMVQADEPIESSGRETIDEPIKQNHRGRIEWVFKDGKWVPVHIGEAEPTKPAAGEATRKESIAKPPVKQQVPEEFGWEEVGAGGVQTRVIKIPTDRLSAGDPRYNIVIRPSDTIEVPVDVIGEFCIMGNVNSQGFINLTGRPMTLKMAIAAAGGLGPLAWPKRCEVIRRIGKDREEIVMVDLDKIAAGEEPDFFIKPNDLINVGTHPTSRWRAVLRNAFRATYGFGFVYDRNFADRDFGTRRPIPSWLF